MAKSTCANPACGLIFSSLSAFDMHQVGEYSKPRYDATGHRVIGRIPSTRRCLSIAEMQARGMVQNEKGWWMTGYADEADLARLAALRGKRASDEDEDDDVTQENEDEGDA